jgi:transcriptional regulator with XRE-family HTH domain
MNGLSERFPSVVRQLRHERGWSQERLAERANLNRSFIGEIERRHFRCVDFPASKIYRTHFWRWRRPTGSRRRRGCAGFFIVGARFFQF